MNKNSTNHFRYITLLFVLFLFAITTFGCNQNSEEVEAKESLNDSSSEGNVTKSISQLTEEGKSPVEISKLIRKDMFYPLPTTYDFSITNVSNAQIRTIKGVVVFIDSDGNYVPGQIAETGVAEFISPGQTVEFQLYGSEDESIHSGIIVVENMTYSSGNFMQRWENPNFAAEIEELTGLAEIWDIETLNEILDVDETEVEEEEITDDDIINE
ncbi:hypothetical protein [Natranaerofaba carboxydovora]|uniref:hypothetical protein n=1 Tax=Natranaerofaba carboxydovora TaxID=2742683 RepID=UPI001F137E28|nr:hypothetical protein [Natranaerofaba carboxydovora]UMZ73663.1 hypothetical protein ACONDI_01226 [Natranaerofaba carboxydovora]